MICPNCKNERWEGETCPNCGLSQKQALLKLAASLKIGGKHELAVDCYNRILQLDPENKEAPREKALCRAQEAISRKDAGLFLRADDELRNILQREWDWEKGHEQRVGLSACFGELEKLWEEYSQEADEDSPQKKTREQTLQTITLMMKFLENPPKAQTSLPQDESVGLWLRSFWPLMLGLFSLPFFDATLPDIREAKTINQYLPVFVAWAFLVSSMVVLFFLSLRFYKNNKVK